jgi:hypothetical protein
MSGQFAGFLTHPQCLLSPINSHRRDFLLASRDPLDIGDERSGLVTNLCEMPMSRHVLLVLLCSASAGCAACHDYCDHCCEKDPVQAEMLRNYNQEAKDYLLRPFMPLEVVQTIRPHLAPGISDLAVLNTAIAPMTTSGIVPVPPAPSGANADLATPAPDAPLPADNK